MATLFHNSLLSETTVFNNFEQGENYVNMGKQKRQSNQAIHECISRNAQTIIQMYSEGQSTRVIGNYFGVSNTAISMCLHDHGIVIRPPHRLKEKVFNENFFHDMETETVTAQYQYYILGLLLADGTNSLTHQTVTLSLQERDKDILEKIATVIDLHNDLQYINVQKYHPDMNCSNQYRMSLFSKALSEDLANLGMVPNKTVYLTFPEHIPETELPHFIRGFFDGDGCVSYSSDRVYINFVGTVNFIEPLAQHIEMATGIKGHVGHPKGKSDFIRTLAFSAKKDVARFLEFLYTGSLIHMNRKYEKAQYILNNMNNLKGE